MLKINAMEAEYKTASVLKEFLPLALEIQAIKENKGIISPKAFKNPVAQEQLQQSFGAYLVGENGYFKPNVISDLWCRAFGCDEFTSRENAGKIERWYKVRMDAADRFYNFCEELTRKSGKEISDTANTGILASILLGLMTAAGIAATGGVAALAAAPASDALVPLLSGLIASYARAWYPAMENSALLQSEFKLIEEAERHIIEYAPTQEAKDELYNRSVLKLLNKPLDGSTQNFSRIARRYFSEKPDGSLAFLTSTQPEVPADNKLLCAILNGNYDVAKEIFKSVNGDDPSIIVLDILKGSLKQPLAKELSVDATGWFRNGKPIDIEKKLQSLDQKDIKNIALKFDNKLLDSHCLAYAAVNTILGKDLIKTIEQNLDKQGYQKIMGLLSLFTPGQAEDKQSKQDISVILAAALILFVCSEKRA